MTDKLFDTIEIIPCECCTHGVSVFYDEETATTWLNYWENGRGRIPFLSRLRYALNILKGEIVPDHVGLSPDSLERFIVLLSQHRTKEKTQRR